MNKYLIKKLLSSDADISDNKKKKKIIITGCLKTLWEGEGGELPRFNYFYFIRTILAPTQCHLMEKKLSSGYAR